MNSHDKLERMFRAVSYGVVLCGFLSLWTTGVLGAIASALFVFVLTLGWLLEDTRWRIGERTGTAVLVLMLPAYYFLWRSGTLGAAGRATQLPIVLGQLVLTLSAIKVLQEKSDRDWVFLYLMAFFEVLLAAGMSISLTYFASFAVFVLVAVTAVILFEIRRARRTHISVAGPPAPIRLRRISVAAVLLILLTAALAGPIFFLVPRVGGAGFGVNRGGALNTSSGFSDTVTLGGIGTIQENDAVVMRVKVEGAIPGEIRWRGLALDTFDNLSWKKSRSGYTERIVPGERDVMVLGQLRSREGLVQQTVYLEPITTPIVFAMSRAIALQGQMSFLLRDRDGAMIFPSRGERTSYRVFSEPPPVAPLMLRRDNSPYSPESFNYLQLPDDLDPRIAELASAVTRDTSNRYDSAAAIERHLQTQFGYTLEQKAGGDQPLSDFLFNVREGHCEYFATAMAVMLRTQGIATRIVNGFQRGDYNETADVYVVRQRNAHSWVEVYFPSNDIWIAFDPTPFAGQNLTGNSAGFTARFNSYLEALETFWIQYFVAFDSAEQRSMFTSVRRSLSNYGSQTSSLVEDLRLRIEAWWQQARGDAGFEQSLRALAAGIGVLIGLTAVIFLLAWAYRRIKNARLWRRLRIRLWGGDRNTSIEFYRRMLEILEGRGLARRPHQTPFEFATEIGDERVVRLTQLYNAVRFGRGGLSGGELKEIEESLEMLRRSSP